MRMASAYNVWLGDNGKRGVGQALLVVLTSQTAICAILDRDFAAKAAALLPEPYAHLFCVDLRDFAVFWRLTLDPRHPWGHVFAAVRRILALTLRMILCPSIVPEPPPMAAIWRARADFGAQRG
jgi:hypothetical protein